MLHWRAEIDFHAKEQYLPSLWRPPNVTCLQNNIQYIPVTHFGGVKGKIIREDMREAHAKKTLIFLFNHIFLIHNNQGNRDELIH